MKINEELAEKPEHGHYPVCLGRLNAINAYCRRSFFYTAAVCLLMIILTIFTIRFNVISWLPNLIGDGTTVGANLVQTLLLLAMAGMSALAVGKYKFFNMLLFVIYLTMAFSCFFTNYFFDVLSFFIGAVGAALTFKSFSAFLDYRQLSQTEGFPFFNKRLAEQEENSEYVSRYGENITGCKDKVMDEPKQSVQPAEFTGKSLAAEMDSLDKSAVIPELPEISRSVDKLYAPQHKKYCAMLESPRKLS